VVLGVVVASLTDSAGSGLHVVVRAILMLLRGFARLFGL